MRYRLPALLGQALLGLLLPVLATPPAAAQAPDSSLDAHYIDFSVPNLSAFTLLGINADRISRPGNVRELATGLTNGFGTRGSLEHGTGLEVALFRVLANPRSLDQYRPIRDRFTLSAAAVREADTTRFGLGFRWVLFDQADPYDSANGLHARIVDVLAAALDSGLTDRQRQIFAQQTGRFFVDVLRSNGRDTTGAELVALFPTLSLGAPADEEVTASAVERRVLAALTLVGIPALTTEQRDRLAAYAAEYAELYRIEQESEPQIDAELEAAIIRVKKEFREEHWNAFSLQIAGGSTFRTTGGPGDLAAEEASAFASLSYPIIPRYGQFLLHIQARYPLQEATGAEFSGAIGGRLLIGSSTRRLSLEALYGANDSRLEAGTSFRFTVGGEFRLADGTYLELATGVNNPEEGGSSFLTLGALRYALRSDRRFAIP